MIEVLSTNIVSPLGNTAIDNYKAVKAGVSAIDIHEGILPEPICASLFTSKQNRELNRAGLTRFESLVYNSITEALNRVQISPAARVVFILATTKGNIEHLLTDSLRLNLAETAHTIARVIPVVTDSIVVCNACISGVSAQLLALRLLESNYYDYAIVCGADCIGKFITSGFSSLKALSSEQCRPFDIERNGLNLGEAAATIIFGRSRKPQVGAWFLHDGAIRNDAHHVSNPSNTAEGCWKAIQSTISDDKEIACVSVHGTATLFNDQMEAVALSRSGLSDLPILAIKGYYGHTLGATGVLETILSMYSIDDKETIPTIGFNELGVSRDINISANPIPIKGDSFLKVISGFGGCNAALYFSKNAEDTLSKSGIPSLRTKHHLLITSNSVILDGTRIEVTVSGKPMLTELYKKYINDYPKFYKMDMLSRLAFVASELLLQAEGNRIYNTEERAVILFNNSSSIVADKEFSATISEGNFYPSPSAFIYTLPNISTGEIAIRNKYYGETSFYILKEKSEKLINDIVASTFTDKGIQSAICGWIDCDDEETFNAELLIKERI